MPTPEIVWVGQAYDLIRPLWITVNKLETAGELWRRAENLAHDFAEQPWRIVCIDSDHAIRGFRGWVSGARDAQVETGNDAVEWTTDRSWDQKYEHRHFMVDDEICIRYVAPRPLPGPILAPASDLGEAWPAFVAELIGGG